jgi:site-specific DNA-methyltransferase (adenine-specific)
MSAPRTDVYWRMCQMIEEAGFEVDFTPIVWAYSSGFPKALNISKAIDRKLGVKQDIVGRAKGMGKQNPEFNGTAQGRSENYLKPEYDKTKATSEQAKKFDGSYAGFQPKPSVEMVILGMKPINKKTFVEQALDNGKGISWFDDCRIPYESENDLIKQNNNFKSSSSQTHSAKTKFTNIKNHDQNIVNPKGRFPANLLVSDNSLDIGIITKGSNGKINLEKSNNDNPCRCYQNNIKSGQHYNDSGDFSRYFNLDKWYETQFAIFPKANKSERNKGCENIKKQEREIRGNNQATRACKKCGLTDNGTNNHSNCNGEFEYKQCESIFNNHPTIKPKKQLSYLITLFSREGDIIVDPFMGSGTTGVSAIELKRKFIGIELMDEYIEISKSRIVDIEKEENNKLF